MQKTVLIAEDHTDIRVMTRFMVESFGFSVVEARDGSEAFEEAKEHRPDLILMDIAMPVMNGITAAGLIRKCESCREVPIIALTAYGRDYVGDPQAFGFDKVVEKPVDMAGMRILLGEYLDC